MKIHVITFLLLIVSCRSESGEFICKPCNLPCDELVFERPGICPHCSMDLVKKSELVPKKPMVLNQIDLEVGSGKFLVEGGFTKEKTIEVHYHLPSNFDADSNVLLVVPGAGRNADSYRNSWIEVSEKFNVLVVSLMYREDDYDYGAYHLGNLMTNLNLTKSVEFDENSNNVFLNEDKFSAELNTNRNQWIFNDFDRIFKLVVNKLKASQTEYDIFGHSAGGQILHRFAIFQPSSSANRIVAANSGSYTLPDKGVDMPFGVKNMRLSEVELRASFQKNLTLLVGELDNENEKGGLLLRSPTVDKQGLHRLARGKYFFNQSKRIAKDLNFKCNWKLKIVPNVGHDQKKMAMAAADMLYGFDKN